MKILVACEESGRVTQAFREKGHEAWSCDLKPTSGNLPEYHIQKNVLNIIDKEKWDMLIGFPPCTYFSKMNFLNYFRKGKFNEERWEKSKEYVDFFMKLYNANIEKICLENPEPLYLFKNILPKPSMYLQPYEYGENYSKKTGLWLKNLPPLIPTLICEKEKCLITPTSGFEPKETPEKRSERRSKTPWGVAYAMAQQWGNF